MPAIIGAAQEGREATEQATYTPMSVCKKKSVHICKKLPQKACTSPGLFQFQLSTLTSFPSLVGSDIFLSCYCFYPWGAPWLFKTIFSHLASAHTEHGSYQVPYFKESSTQKFSPIQDLNVKSRGGWEHTIVKTLIFKWRACCAQYGLRGKNSAGEPARPLKPKAYACDALSILFMEHIGFGYLIKKK